MKKLSLVVALCALPACKPTEKQATDGPIILNCEAIGTNSSRDYIQPSIGQPPTAFKEQMTLRISANPLRFETWSDEKNAFQPLCSEGSTCKSSQSEAEFRLTTNRILEDKNAGWWSEDKTNWIISRTSGSINIDGQFVHKSKFSHLVMTHLGSGNCKRGDIPLPKF